MDAATYAQLSRIAPVVGPPEGFPDWGAPWQEELRLIARATGRDDRAETVIADVDAVLADTRAQYPAFDGASVAVAHVAGTKLVSLERIDLFERDLALWLADTAGRELIEALPAYQASALAQAGRSVWADEDETGAMSFQTPLSIPWAAQRLAPKFQTRIARGKSGLTPAIRAVGCAHPGHSQASADLFISISRLTGPEMIHFPAPRFPRRSLNGILAGCTAICSAALAAQSAQAQEAAPMELPSILLRYELDYSGRVDGYLAPATETGVKSGVPLSEVPQSISVVTSTELEARQPDEVEDAIAYVPGITASTWGTDDRFDQFSIRGFDMGTNALYRDGLPQKALSFSAFSTDPYMIDRVDVLRGPAGVLYGSNDAGVRSLTVWPRVA